MREQCVADVLVLVETHRMLSGTVTSYHLTSPAL